MRRKRNTSSGACALCGLAVALILAAPSPALNEEAPVLVEEALSGTIELARKIGLTIEGFRGAVSIRPGDADEIVFSSRTPNRSDSGSAVGVWATEDRYRLTPVPEEDGQGGLLRELEVLVPPGLPVRVLRATGTLEADGLQSNLSVEGKEITVAVSDLAGSLQADLLDGKLIAERLGGTLTLVGGNLDAEVRQVTGVVALTLAGSSARLSELESDLISDLEATPLSAESLGGTARITARGGTVDLAGLEKGGTFRMFDTPMGLVDSKGLTDVETDASFVFKELAGDLRVVSMGGEVRGSGIGGRLDLTTHDGQVEVRSIFGPTSIGGSGSAVRLERTHGEVRVRTVDTTVIVDGAAAAVELECENGDITLSRVDDRVLIVSSGGSIRILEQSGPLHVEAAGPRVVVDWIKLTAQDDSFVSNEDGEVWLELPPGAGGSIEATSVKGTIRSEITEVEISDEGQRASGILREEDRPRIEVRSYEDLYLLTGRPRAPEG